MGINGKIKSFFWHAKAMVFVVCFLLCGCTTTTKPKKSELPKIAVELVRFEALFYGDLEVPLQKLKTTFPYLFPAFTDDTIWIDKRTDSLQQVLYEATQSLPKNELKGRVEKVLKYAKFYFPSEKLPNKIVTLQTDVDYSLRAVDADSLLLISIDTYLGDNHPLYEGIPKYIKETLSPNHLEAEIIDALSHRFLPKVEDRTFLAQCLHEGKRLMLHDYFAPDVLAIHKIQYSEKSWKWAETHESEIWRFFVDNEYLFSTNENLKHRFLSPGPYSKFYTFLDTNSPGRIGQWIGYRIIQAYQKRTGASLHQVLTTDTQELLKKSRYNP